MSNIADRIARDIRTRAPYHQPEDELDGLDHAYRIQAEVTEALLGDVPGRRIAGYKIAFNRGASMDYYGLSEPCYAPLFSDQIYRTGRTFALAQFSDLVIEPEIAVRMGARLTGGEDDATVAAAIGALLPAIEVMDVRGAFAGDPSAAAAVAHRVHSQGAVIGADYSGEAPDIAIFVARLTVAGAPAGEATGAAPQTPVEAIRWLAGRLGKDGLPLDEGMLVLTGTHLPARRTSELGEILVTLEPIGSVSMVLA